MVQSRSLSLTTAFRRPPPMSSISKQLIGQLLTRASAASPSTSPRMSMRGSSRYHAVATGDHLACPRSPLLFPLWQCTDRSISWPGLRRAMRMSLWTGSGLSLMKRSSWSPKGTHSSCDEKTLPLDPSLSAACPPAGFLHLTLRRNLMTSSGSRFPLTSSASRVAGEGIRKLAGSALIGINPRRCATSSSRRTPVLLAMKTFSIAIVGTSESRMRLKALATATSMPLMSNVMSSSWISRILILNRSRHVSMLKASSSGNVPEGYVAVCRGAVPWQMT
mmetsp:Transcript_31457/g.77118  ORF Transcript_31457/g.77118 Transcript_31457/m.77118 type:complete len:277 (+) Transcript_31457:290-1120(+)